MLNIGKVGAGGAQYYLDTVASGAEEYYTGSGEAPGFWLGSAAADLGLVGLVEPEALRSVLAATDPESGVALTGRATRRVPGYALVLPVVLVTHDEIPDAHSGWRGRVDAVRHRDSFDCRVAGGFSHDSGGRRRRTSRRGCRRAPPSEPP